MPNVLPVRRMHWLSRFALGLLLLIIAPGMEARAQTAVTAAATTEPALYYAIERQATVYARPDSSRPYLSLELREPVHLLGQEGHWRLVRTQDGAEGYIDESAISNVWIRVSKRSRMVYVYRGTKLVSKLPADFGYNNFSDKQQRGSTLERDHWRTPEGTFYVVAKNPRSQFYKAFVLNYPTAEDAERGLREGLISRAEHDRILQAQASFSMPPMGTALGGWIEIHGDGTGSQADWTQGCVAIRNQHMNQLWSWVHVGTPVVIE